MTAEREKTPSKEQWAEIAEKLSGVFGHVCLLIDGFRFTIHRQLVKKNTLTNVVYVNGLRKGEWIKNYTSDQDLPELPEETRRFFRPRSRPLLSKKMQASYTKAYGKKRAEQKGIYRTFHWFEPYWPSVGPLKNHLLKNNVSIEYFPDGFPKEDKNDAA